VTARRRRQLGHRVVTLDPFSVLGPGSDGLNPFDLFALPGAQPDCDSEMLAELITGGVPMCSKDLFWDHTGRGLLTGLLGRAAEETDPARRHLATVLDYLYADDADYAIAVMLDTHPFQNQLARQEMVAYLGHESDRCRPSVRSTAVAACRRHIPRARTDVHRVIHSRSPQGHPIRPPSFAPGPRTGRSRAG
jgi:type IV secretion system protein VirD4